MRAFVFLLLALQPCYNGAFIQRFALAPTGLLARIHERSGSVKGTAGRRNGFAPTMSHTITPAEQGGFFIEEKLEVFVGGKTLKFETGKIGRTADGSVTLTVGECVLYSSAVAGKDPMDVDFTPLRVDYFERFSAAGMTSGSYTKRDGKASDREILISRLIDRPLRPMFPETWTCDTQLVSWVLSYDRIHCLEPLAICAASAAVAVSSIPTPRPIAGVQVGLVDGKLVINPTKAEMEVSKLNLMIAGTEEGILMIEGAADFLPEETVIEALREGHESIKTICRALSEWSAKVGRPKRVEALREPPKAIKEMLADYVKDIDTALRTKTRRGEDGTLASIGNGIYTKYSSPDAEVQFDVNDMKREFKKLVKQRICHMVSTENLRPDGRKVDQVRPISIELGVLPVPHGSCLFTRGDTQALVTVTLGNKNMAQRSDSLDGNDQKRFYLQYFFPPSSVNEVGRLGAPGRREIGHGNLAERALVPSIPSEEEFPYFMRVESMITESCGSSSMASACGGSLALMDAGVPVSRHVAGVAMGLLLDDSLPEPIILTDILGLEDAFGTMDFKVCGDDKGIATFQLDIKCEGLTFETLDKALRQAKVGRLHILDIMQKACPGPSPELRANVPRITQMKIDPSFIGKLIGPSGRQIRAIIEEFSLTELDVTETGLVSICSPKTESNQGAKKFISELIKDERSASATVEYRGPPPEVGTVFRGVEVRGVQNFGVFVEILPGLQGLVHVSELNTKRVTSVEGLFKVGDKVDVKLLGINEKGQLRLSRKAVLLEDSGATPDSPAP